jgi:hypothetical protein
MSASTNDDLSALRGRIAERHHFAGWVLLLVFVSLGAVLESLHGFKIGFYLDVSHQVRREMWTLAHAHGTLLAICQILFALGLQRFGRWSTGSLRLASFFLLDAAVLMPLGFFLGGIGHAEGDPSLGVVLVPIGAVLLIVAVALIARSAWPVAEPPPPSS